MPIVVNPCKRVTCMAQRMNGSIPVQMHDLHASKRLRGMQLDDCGVAKACYASSSSCSLPPSFPCPVHSRPLPRSGIGSRSLKPFLRPHDIFLPPH